MDLKQIKYFLAVSEHGSVASAAASLNLAQPSLSQQIKNLENSLDTELFTRTSRGVTLTLAGKQFKSHCNEILALVSSAVEEVRSVGSNISGSVVIGFPSSVSMVLSVPLQETICHEHPEINLRLVESMSGFINQMLENGDLDMAILYENNNLRNFDHKYLLRESLKFYAAADTWPFESLPNEPIELKSLGNLEFVFPSTDHGTRNLVTRAFKLAGCPVKIFAEMDSLPQIKSLVARGSAYTILPPAATYDFESRRELVSAPIINPTIDRSVFFVKNLKKPHSAAMLKVEEVIHSVVIELVSRGLWQGSRIQ